MLRGIGLRDQIKTVRAAQMIATYNMAIEVMRLARLNILNVPVAEHYMNCAGRLMRLFTK